MANVSLWGGNYPGVPALDVPQTGGGTVRFHECVGSEEIDENGTYDVTGLAEVEVDVEPVLQEKTVTPNSTTQVITADQGGTTVLMSINNVNGTGAYISGNEARMWEETWSETPVVGETYHITLSATRAYRSRTYSFDDDIVWTGFPFTLTPTVSPSGSGVETFEIDSDYIYHRASDADSTFYLTISFEKRVPHYDALSQVTVLPASGGGGDTYTRTVIVPQQTTTGQTPTLTHTGALVDGDFYVVTIDGTEYITTAEVQWSGGAIVLGTLQWYYTWDPPGEYDYPWAVGYEIASGDMDCAFPDSGAHTIKVEHLEFVDGPLNLITKNISANGTYNASSDNADGYSQVNVNVPSGGGTYQAKEHITPTESNQTITPDPGFDALSSVQIDPISSDYVGSGVTKKAAATYYPSASDQSIASGQYLNGAQTIKGVVISGLSADKVLAGTTVKVGDSVDDDRIASVAGSVVIQHYYTGSGNPSSSLGANGDIYLKTS